ncbi:unnamed protein product [Ilex paraguariensis]|uniref:Tail specific protease domain-containing protein n=1 Tax=Ilex paraguariensis TaxID=185542 RepID=A0ABC8RMV3_9AQUA
MFGCFQCGVEVATTLVYEEEFHFVIEWKEAMLFAAIKRLQDNGASFFVLDLRDNLGGLVQAGIETAKLFLTEGETVAYTVGRDPHYVNNIAAETAPLISAPVIVLVNNSTASASEIVATALHDNCKAVLVGERTFGKGLIQSVFELHDGSGLVVTVGKYVTPNHMDINGNGIEPDFHNFPAWNEPRFHPHLTVTIPEFRPEGADDLIGLPIDSQTQS